jgi:hypothetical protein
MRARVPAFPNSAAKVHYFFEIAATFAGKLTITFDERHITEGTVPIVRFG